MFTIFSSIFHFGKKRLEKCVRTQFGNPPLPPCLQIVHFWPTPAPVPPWRVYVFYGYPQSGFWKYHLKSYFTSHFLLAGSENLKRVFKWDIKTHYKKCLLIRIKNSKTFTKLHIDLYRIFWSNIYTSAILTKKFLRACICIVPNRLQFIFFKYFSEDLIYFCNIWHDFTTYLCKILLTWVSPTSRH